jgi:hypothetical protein
MLADRGRKRPRQLDREHRRGLRRVDTPGPRRALGITAALPLRAPEPARQHAGSLSHRNTRVCQVSRRVDPLGILTSTNPVTSHAVNILPDMSHMASNTPRPFQPPVAQRDIKAEVAHCVGGVISPLLLNIAMQGMEEAAGARYDKNCHAKPGTPTVITYADDFVALCHSREQAEAVRNRLSTWLKPRGLSFNQDKTQIVRVPRAQEGEVVM